MSASELRNELRELRKTHKDYAPVSKMQKADISALIQRLKLHTAETPSAGQMSDKSKKIKPVAESANRSKEVEHSHSLVEEHSGTKKGMPRKTARKAYESESDEEDSKKEKKAPKKKVEKKEVKKEVKEGKKEEKKGKPAKGSPEMAERMRKLREARGKSKK